MIDNNIQNKRKRKRQRSTQIASLIGSIFLSLLTLAAITLCLIMVFKYRAIQQENIAVLNEIETMNQEKEIMFTKTEMDELISNAVEEAVSQNTESVTREVTDGLKNDIRERINNEDSMTSILRNLFPEDVVMYEAGRYYCIPIIDSLKMNTYDHDAFRIDDDGFIAYYENDEVVSHKGIDVSKYQDDIDWKKVASDDIEYAYIRLGIRGYTEGEIKPDDRFEKNIEGAKDNNIGIGVYFFSQATSVSEAEEEAQYVLDAIEPYPVDYPVVIDVEEISAKNGRTKNLTKEERTEYCIAFCEKIKNAGYTPMIYGNLHTFMMMLDIEQLEEYDKWFAYYGEDYYFPYEFRVWQYTDKGNVSGIKKDVDMNISFEK